MFKNEKVLGIIPARGGSKRLLKKNIQLLGGKPLVAWSIQAAQETDLIDKVVVSTEDAKISEVAIQWGVDDVIHRSEQLSGDDASTNNVIIEVLENLEEKGERYGYLVLLQPTSPLRTAAHIKSAFSRIEVSNAIGAVSVCRTEHPMEWMGKISDDGSMDSFIKTTELEKSSQEFSPSYQINGAIYISNVNKFLEEKTVFLKSGMVVYEMDRASSVDIDDEYDLQLASWLIDLPERSVTSN